MSLCECGCGGEASPGCRFIKGHHMKGKKFSKKSIQKGRETRKVNKEIREGKRPAPELPLCKCRCGGRVTRPGNKYITGHNQRGKPSPMKGKKPWNYGKTKETNENLRKSSEKISKTKKAFFATEEGQMWIDNNFKGKNHPSFGKKPWNFELTKENDKRVKKYGETRKERYANGEINVWCEFKNKEDDPRLMQLSKSLLSFYQSEEGIKLKDNFSEKRKGEGNSFFSKEHTDEAKLRMKEKHSTDEAKQKHREFRKNQKFPKHHTDIELRCEDFSIKNSIPVTYTGDSSFWIPAKNNGNKCVNPDFILYANGKKFAIELLGDYWHSPFLNKNVMDDDLKNRKKHYRRYKWIPIFIWGSDIMRHEGEKFFLSELKKAGAI